MMKKRVGRPPIYTAEEKIQIQAIQDAARERSRKAKEIKQCHSP